MWLYGYLFTCVLLISVGSAYILCVPMEVADLLLFSRQQVVPGTIRHPGDIHRVPSHSSKPQLPADEVAEEEVIAVPHSGKKGVRWSQELEEVKSIPSHQRKEEEEARVINPTPSSVGN